MQSAKHTFNSAAHAADKGVVKPVVHQTQNTAADTKRWLQRVVSPTMRPLAYSSILEAASQASRECAASALIYIEHRKHHYINTGMLLCVEGCSNACRSAAMAWQQASRHVRT